MARQNPEDSRTGWKARRARGRNRGRSHGDRAEIRAARQAAAQAEETGFNPEVQTTAPAADDFVSALSDADLVALYKQLHNGREPKAKAKRPAIERAVRAKQAEQAQASEAPEYIDRDERPTEEDGDPSETVEGE